MNDDINDDIVEYMNSREQINPGEDIFSKEDIHYDIIQNMTPRKEWDLIIIEETARDILNPEWFLVGFINEAKKRQKVDWANRDDFLHWREIERELLQIEQRVKTKMEPPKPPSLMSRARTLRDEAIQETNTDENYRYYEARFNYLFRYSDQLNSYLTKIVEELSDTAKRELKNTAMNFRRGLKHSAPLGRPPKKK